MQRIYVYFMLCGIALLSSVDSALNIKADHGKVAACHINQESFRRAGLNKYALTHFDASLCTHVIYGYAGLDESEPGIKVLDPDMELSTEYRMGLFAELDIQKAKNPELKTLISVGGPNVESEQFSRLVRDETFRTAFAQSALIFLSSYRFNGLDISWQYPTRNGGHSEDVRNYLTWLEELSAKLKLYGLILTATIGAEKTLIEDAYHITELFKHPDYIFVRSFNYHDNPENYNAPLMMNDRHRWSVVNTINYLLRLGALKSKLVLGIPFSGRMLKVLPVGSTDELRTMPYNDVCVNHNNGWNFTWLEVPSQVEGRSPWLANDSYSLRVIFDNTRSVALKSRYAIANDLAGVMAWSVDSDDYLNICPVEYDTFNDFQPVVLQPKVRNKKLPLLRTMNMAIKLALLEVDPDVLRDEGNY